MHSSLLQHLGFWVASVLVLGFLGLIKQAVQGRGTPTACTAGMNILKVRLKKKVVNLFSCVHLDCVCLMV